MANFSAYRKNERENIDGFNKPLQRRKSGGQRRKVTEQDIIARGLDEFTEIENENIESEEGMVSNVNS